MEDDGCGCSSSIEQKSRCGLSQPKTYEDPFDQAKAIEKRTRDAVHLMISFTIFHDVNMADVRSAVESVFMRHGCCCVHLLHPHDALLHAWAHWHDDVIEELEKRRDNPITDR